MNSERESAVWIREARQIDELLEKNAGGAFLLKHSSRCPVSSRALSIIQAHRDRFQGREVRVLDIIKNRDWSNRVADLTRVRHESPQLLYLHLGECIEHWNHFEIEPDAISNFLSSLGESEG